MICQCRRWWARSRLLQYRTLLLGVLLLCLFCFIGLHWDYRVYEQALRKSQNFTRTLAEKLEVQAVLHADVMRLKPRSTPSSLTESPNQVVTPQQQNYSVAELEEELASRRQRVWEVCTKHNLYKDGQPNAWEFFIDERHHLVWCNIFKAASSSWMYNFNLLGGYKEPYLKRTRKTPLLLARARFPRPSAAKLLNELPRSLSFLIVRDPFERLLSAYRNKIENFRHKFYRRLALAIMRKYQPKGKQYKTLLRGPSFEQFVQYVIDTAKENKSDEHWAPYYQFCTPCHVNFTVIAKTETLNRDQDYIIKKVGIQNIVKPQVINVAKGLKTEQVLFHYFQQLGKETLNRLYDVYRIDFEMFDYNASRYFNMVTS